MFKKYFDIAMTDVDSENICRPSAIFRILQEVSDRQMLEEKPSYRELFDRGMAFVLSRMTVLCLAPLHQYDRICAEVWPAEPMGVIFPRYYRLYRGDEVVAEAASQWALVDVNDRHIIRSAEVDLSGYTYGEPILPGALRFRLPKDGFENAGEHRVAYGDVDINRHMNNTAYPDMLMECMPDCYGGAVKKLCIHYVSEAPHGSVIRIERTAPQISGETETCFFRTFIGERENIEAVVTITRH